MVTPNDKPANTQSETGRQEKAKILRLLLLQAALTVMMSAAGWYYDPEFAVAILTGGFIGFMASLWMAVALLRPSAAETPGKLLSALYVGELGKYLFVMAFFAIAFKKIAIVREPHNALLMIGAFTVTQLVIWLWPLLAEGVGRHREI